MIRLKAEVFGSLALLRASLEGWLSPMGDTYSEVRSDLNALLTSGDPVRVSAAMWLWAQVGDEGQVGEYVDLGDDLEETWRSVVGDMIAGMLPLEKARQMTLKEVELIQEYIDNAITFPANGIQRSVYSDSDNEAFLELFRTTLVNDEVVSSPLKGEAIDINKLPDILKARITGTK